MKKNIFKLLLAVITVGSMSSCLKDDSLVLDPEKGHNVIEFANPAQIVRTGTPSAMYAFAYEVGPTVVELPITISYSGPEATAPEDINVKFGVGTQAKIDEYNTATGDHLEKLNTAAYSLSATEVVIKKGTSKATFIVRLVTTAFDFTKKEALPLTITSASSGVISGNFGTILLNVSGKNKYDGVYTVTNLVFNNVTNAGHTANSPRVRHLVTSSLTTNYSFDPNLNGGLQGISFLNAGSGSYYGNFSPVFAFGTNDAVTAVTNYYPANSQGRAAAIDPTGVNKYTIVTGGGNTLEVSYIMTVNGVNTLFLKEKWVRTGARP